MRDERVVTLARNLTHYSIAVQPGDTVFIEYKGSYSRELLKELISAVVAAGGLPFWFDYDESLQRRLLRAATEETIKAHGQLHLDLMRRVTCFLSVRGSDNPFDLSDVPAEALRWHTQHYVGPVHIEQRVQHTRWCVLRYPNNAMAQLAERAQEEFEDFFFRVCNLDYARMSAAMDPLVATLQATDRVRIVAPDTDLTFSVRGMPAIKCDGKVNIPDGEVFTAPVRDSIEGRITFNAPTLFQGTLFERIRLTFARGRVVDADAGPATAALRRILEQDEGAAYVGEFALGVNPHIERPMKDTLFDEKIRGSVHMALGNAYAEAPNGNRSAIHWDLVLIQTPAHGGGALFFDDRLVRLDGRFVVPELEPLNPERLMA